MASAMVFTSTAAKSLKKTLDNIVDDKTDGLERGVVCKRWLKMDTMDEAYVDDQEYGGGGLLSEKAEGGQLATISMQEGVTTRYIARTFGAKMLITEEAIEDIKYKEVIDLARRLKRSGIKTYDIDATMMLMRAFNPAYTGGDGQPLISDAHTLPHGGSFSNKMAVPMSPSRTAVVIAETAVRMFPGHDGITEGAEITKVVFPMAQWATWSALFGSKFTPEANNFAEVNVVNKDLHHIEQVPVKYWTNTTTNYIFITDVDNGLQFKWRRKLRGKSWVDNDNEVMNYSTSARWARGWTDPRCAYGVEA